MRWLVWAALGYADVFCLSRSQRFELGAQFAEVQACYFFVQFFRQHVNAD